MFCCKQVGKYSTLKQADDSDDDEDDDPDHKCDCGDDDGPGQMSPRQTFQYFIIRIWQDLGASGSFLHLDMAPSLLTHLPSCAHWGGGDVKQSHNDSM